MRLGIGGGGHIESPVVESAARLVGERETQMMVVRETDHGKK